MMTEGSDYFNANAYDTDDNASDFVITDQEMQKSTSPTEICSEIYPNIIITEFMYNPDPLDGTQYEWVEIYNAGDQPINID